jgi:Ca2+-binding RTX toxin-like protein
MAGGPGNDYYFVDSISDQVAEVLARGAGGKDTVETSVSYAAPVNVENLIAKAGIVIDLTGNELDNQLSGNELVNILMGGAGTDILMGFAGNDTLDGGTGVDRLAGGLGDDLYRVDSRSDLILEYQGEGIDTVEARTTYTLASNIENLTLLEGGDWAGGGNSLNNIIIGNSGNNTLSGGLGADTLKGGLGNDIYVVNDALDTIIDIGGVDTIRTSLSTLLLNDIERLELIGLGDITGVGNASDNVIIGNPGDNYLEGGAGIDILTGGAGGDGFYIAYNGVNKSADTITDFSSGEDLIMLDLASFGVSASSLGLSSSGMAGSDSLVSGAGAHALDPNDYLIYDTAKMTLYFDADGSGAGIAVEAVKLTGISDLHTSDIYISV